MELYGYYSFGPEMDRGLWYLERMLDGVLPVLIVILAVLCLAVIAFALVTYVLQSVGLYTMAKRRGIQNPWLAWIPIGNRWLLGALADDANIRRGQKTSYGIILLAVTAASALSGLGLLVNPLIGIFSGLAGLAAMVVYYIALYEVYQDYSPKNAVLFLVLSILLSAQWIIVFILRNRRPVSCGGSPDGPAAPQQGYPQQPVGPVPFTPQPPVPAQPSAPVRPQADAQPEAPVGWVPGGQTPPARPAQAPACPPEHWDGMISVSEDAAPIPPCSESESNFPEENAGDDR